MASRVLNIKLRLIVNDLPDDERKNAADDMEIDVSELGGVEDVDAGRLALIIADYLECPHSQSVMFEGSDEHVFVSGAAAIDASWDDSAHPRPLHPAGLRPALQRHHQYTERRGPMADKISKSDWLARCATRFAEKGGMDDVAAAEYAETCWDVTVDALGGEDAALTEGDPEGAADEEMSYWAD